MFERFLDKNVLPVIETYADRKPTLVFCTSRNNTVNTAQAIARDAGDPDLRAARPYLGRFLSADDCRITQREASKAIDGKLKDVLMSGVGFHHAGLTNEDRRLVEGLFLRGILPVLCTTTSLAMGEYDLNDAKQLAVHACTLCAGVNLPAHLVVVKSTQSWGGSGRGFVEYTRGTILQMLVRMHSSALH